MIGGSGYRYFPSHANCCSADVTKETSVFPMPRGYPPRMKRAKQIHHIKDGIRFWHWSDQSNLKQTEFLPVAVQPD